MEIIQTPAENVTTLLREYETLSNQYTLEAARKSLLDNLITGTVECEPVVSSSNANTLRDAFLAKTRDMANEVSNYQQACLMVDDGDDDANIDAHLRMEIARGEALMQKMLHEQTSVEATITETRRQLEEMNNSDELDAKENQAPGASSTTLLLNIDQTKLKTVQKSHKESSALFTGMSTLMNVNEFHVSEDQEGSVVITATIGKCTVEIVLDADDKRISAIELKTGDLPMRLEKLLMDSRMLPSPQDLRYVIFAITTAQDARTIAMKDIATIKALRTCLFKMLENGNGNGGTTSDDTSLLRFQMELKGRIVAIIAIHVGFVFCRFIFFIHPVNVPSQYTLIKHPLQNILVVYSTCTIHPKLTTQINTSFS